MFYVKSKELKPLYDKVFGKIFKKETYKIYDVQYKNGYPFFLLYENGQWITRSAKYYEPIE